jgi:hypothetical protein
MLPARGPGHGRCAGHRGRAAHPRRGLCGVGPRAFGRPRRTHADPPGRRVVRAGPPRSEADHDEPLARQHRRFRDGHHLAGRAAGGQAPGGARGRLRPDHAVGARHRRPPGRAGGRRAGGARQRPARDRLSGAARLRGPLGPPARLQGRHRQVHAGDVRRAGLENPAGLLVDLGPCLAGPGRLAKDLRKLAMLAIPLGIQVAYEGLSWGRTINEFTTAWEVVSRADVPNLGIGLDSFHLFATETPLDDLELLDPEKIFPGAAGRLHVAGDPFGGGAHHHRAPLPRVPRRGRAQRGAGRPGAPPARAGLPRRLQLRGLQRRLPADSAAGGGAARAPLGAVAGRGRAAPLGAAAEPDAAARACQPPGSHRLPSASVAPNFQDTR